MKKYILFGGYLLLLAYITSCDDGRIYEKTELALLYFPRSEAKVALNRLKRWIKNNPELSEALDDCKVGKFAKYYSRHQVELIVDYLDEP